MRPRPLARLLVPFALALTFGACATNAQRDNERCAARGLEPTSDAYKNCLVDLESERRSRMETRHRDFLERSASPLNR